MNTHSKIHAYLTIAFAFFLPLVNGLTLVLTPLLFANLLIQPERKAAMERLRHPLPILFSFIYIVHLIGLLNTENFTVGLVDIQEKLALLLLPLVYFGMPKFNKDELSRILLFFTAGCTISMLYCELMAFYNYFVTSSTTVFFYTNFTQPFYAFHPSYLSAFSAFSFLVLIHLRQKFPFSKFILFSTLLLHLLFIVQLNSRNGILVFALLASLYYGWYVLKQGLLFKGSLFYAFILLSFGFLLSLSPRPKAKIVRAINSLLTKQKPSDKPYQQEQRIFIWESAISVIQMSPLLGHGTGDVGDELVDNYKKVGYALGVKRRFNSHNQYLQFGIAFGLPALLLFLTYLIYPLILSFKQKHMLYILFLLLIILSMLTESFLELQWGLTFFAFFNSIFASQLNFTNIKN